MRFIDSPFGGLWSICPAVDPANIAHILEIEKQQQKVTISGQEK
jgi:hypothetical protein